MPIHQSATFLFDDIDHFAEVGHLKTSGGFLYSRWANPSVSAMQQVIASLEGAEASLGFASGMAAITTTILALAHGGDLVIASQLYGGTFSAMTTLAARAGIGVTFVDMTDPAAARAAITDRTKLLYCETMSNPAMRIADLDAWSQVSRDAGIPFAIDATFTPPVLLRPIDHGVDLVLHSTTKYLGGHSDHLGGVVSGSAGIIDVIHRQQIDLGGTMAPFEAFLLARGIQTLDLRMDRHSANALRVATWLEQHPAVGSVKYPGLASHPDHELARKLLGDRFSGMLAVELRGGRDAGRRAMERVELFGRAASLGGTKSLIVHPVSVTHTQLNAEDLVAAGLSEGTLRISVGIEDVEDLIADLEQALA